ncbi:hypothetical protein A3C91_02540 [Candidatus Azambacteria bacterium RIFCSPHIGHO2_02_FULL_52_12]|uniref:NADAR domain-containing protein n=1 Tax=Candidatus Azambacteria bacterium RIFCSPLOWO2_01_FULL_46_25 TaxID=1797298 RepID=A0A1F5BVS3_9BACT|nr:MAG: hypothetical protein A3C91_02540 [Candidatus Azambacteria bacterium RIFCSPHIGHO2_02_FULL_52_12]OGD34696.1 MAG: hypothetical protein A2988_04335 [Candidatus Azambacteria bacterium RIFCSPLOWO2_01_FULL_46_25]OGD37466.1 MAG: hypothetical protein A2850_02765 [Candidatus Azambacteria bacterium RIFCSPHIGHO2_01_FULL_51_74]
MRDPILETSGKVIGFYEREFYVFSNFSSFSVEWKGRLWQTSEHAYQASKFFETDKDLVERIFSARSAHEAMKLAQANKDKAPTDWDERKAGVMEDICRHKLKQHPYVQKKLLETGELDMVEDSPKDDFWGWGPSKDGRNELGKVWMRLRKEFITKQAK